IPASSSHTLIGSILGVGLANAMLTDHSLVDGVNWEKAMGVFESLLFSPFIGAGLAGLLLLGLLRFLPKSYIHKTPYQRHVFDKKKRPPFWPRFWLVTSAMGMSYAHGQNDGQKGIGLVMLVLFSVVPAQFVLNLNSSVFEIEQTRVAAQQMVAYYDTNRDVLDRLYPKSDTQVSDGLFSCEYSEMKQHSEKLITLLNGVDTYDKLATEDRWAVRNEVMCLASIAKTLESQDALPSGYRKAYKAISKDLTKTTEYAPFWVIVAVALALGMGT